MRLAESKVGRCASNHKMRDLLARKSKSPCLGNERRSEIDRQSAIAFSRALPQALFIFDDLHDDVFETGIRRCALRDEDCPAQLQRAMSSPGSLHSGALRESRVRRELDFSHNEKLNLASLGCRKVSIDNPRYPQEPPAKKSPASG